MYHENIDIIIKKYDFYFSHSYNIFFLIIYQLLKIWEQCPNTVQSVKTLFG